MPSLGRKLRDERVRQGLQLGDIEKKTRIALRHLEAIEEDCLDRLPAGYFRRSFLRQYADALGIKGADVDLALQNINAEPAQDELARAIMDRPERPPQRPPRRTVAWAVPLLLLTAGSGAYLWWKWRSSIAQQVAAMPPVIPSAVPTAPPAQSQVEASGQTGTVEPSRPPGQEPAQPSQPASPPPQGATTAPPESRPEAPQPDSSPAAGSDRLSLNLQATEQTWISLAAEGKTVFTGVLEKGESKSIAGAERARLVVGNAAGLEVRWNGKIIEPIGPRGHIREILFTRENYQIRVLRKPES